MKKILEKIRGWIAGWFIFIAAPIIARVLYLLLTKYLPGLHEVIESIGVSIVYLLIGAFLAYLIEVKIIIPLREKFKKKGFYKNL